MLIQRARLLGIRQLVFEEQTIADGPPADGFSAVTECSAVSPGTEVAAYLGEPPLRPGPIYPRLVGYCNVARVERVGPDVTQVQPGQRILTHRAHESGFIAQPAEILAVLKEQDSSENAALSYLAQLGLAALQKARFQSGETVAVLGLGVIGLATVALASALGARVIALGNDPLRRARAAELGAQAILDSGSGEIAAEVAAVTEDGGPDIIVTTVNSWGGWHTALEIARFQTRIAVLGFPGRSEGAPAFNPLASAHFHDKQLSILGAGMLDDSAGLLVSPKLRRNIALVLRLARMGRLPLASLVTHRVPPRDLAAIYETAARREKTLIAAILDWSATS